MDWLVLTEYAARFLGGGHAQFNCDEPLVEQRLMIDGELTRSRAFTHKTNLIHVRADAACMIEIDQPVVSTDMVAGAREFFAVLAGGQLTVMKSDFGPSPIEEISPEVL